MERRHVRFLTLLISLLMLVSVCTTTAFASELTISDDPICYLHGDVNGDGEVGTQDAIYALYYAMWHDVDPTLYPIVNQEFDFTGEGKVSAKDALYLLWASYNTEGYELKGEQHEHYNPYWTWDETGAEPTATLTIRCGCGTPVELDADDGVTVTSVTTEATCVAAGKVEYTAKVTYLNKEYESDPFVVTLPVSETGHDFGGVVRDCENGVTCQTPGCDTDSTDDILTPYSLPALGHVLVLDEDVSSPATCIAMGQQVYNCTNEGCQYSHTVFTEMLSHHYEYVEGGDHLVEGTTCTYVKTYKCTVAEHAAIDGTAAEDTYIMHAYTAAMTTEPNCQEKGVKTYTCSVEGCTDSYTEDVAPNGVHHWDNGVTSGNITTYTCEISGCGETKTSVVPDADGSITKEALDSATELKVGDDDTSVALGSEALSDLNAEDKVVISVSKVTDLDATNLSADELAQVDGDAVYDFSLEVNGVAQSEFGGEITVTIPYTLQPGDDVDSIDIWYIDDNGNLAPEPMRGVYCNGYVTFKTTHFSYYTVTRLTPAERCQRYGHIWVSSDKAATCTEGGYNMSVCQRCGAVDESNKTIIAPLGHDYAPGSSAVEATCTTPGWVHKVCQRGDCNHTVEEEIPAMGHNMVKDEDRSSGNSCYNPGVLVTACTNCDLEVVEDLPQLQHSFKEKPETEHPTCNSSGKKQQKCELCGEKIKLEDIVPLGHDYMVVTNGWHWNEDRTSATVDLICKNNPKHTQTRKAVVTMDEAASSPATCTAGGYLVYTATSTFNKATFTDTITVEQDATGHLTSGAWEKNASQHFRYCDTCGQRADYADHKWGSVTVTKEPTCQDSGSANTACLVCGYATTETIPATGEHDLVDGVCADCGFTENTCNHNKLRSSFMSVDDPNVCPGLVLNIEKCDCGQKGIVMIWEATCDFESEWIEDENGYRDIMRCKTCGLTYEYTETSTIDESTCSAVMKSNRKVTVGDTVLADYADPSESVWKHPSVYDEGEVIQLSQYGLCGGTITKYSCLCGEVKDCATETLCDIENDVCKVCGAEWIAEHSEEKKGCEVYYNVDWTIKVDGEEVLSYTVCVWEGLHNFKVADYEVFGDSCEDGIMLHYVCADCGEESYSNFGFHLTAITTTTDLTGYGSCASVITRATCCCGQVVEWYEGPSQYEQAEHNWIPVSMNGNTTVETCSICNYTHTTTITESAKDANCMVTVARREKFTDGKGHEYSMDSDHVVSRHENETSYELRGGSCDDGVRVRITCKDCGESHVTEEYEGHRGFVTEEHNLSDYGICGGRMTVYACVCGKDVWVYREEGFCNYEYVDGGMNYSVNRCVNCGTEELYRSEVVATVDDCHDRVRFTNEFFRNGTSVLNVQYVTVMDTHRDVVTYDLNDSDAGCEGGYTATYTCLDCGETRTEEVFSETEHWTRPVARQIVSTNQLCGDLEFVTESCACGKNVWINESWMNGNCEFQWTDYDHTRQCEIYTCTKCGAVREEVYVWTPIAGETCKQDVLVSVSYFKNGIDAGSHQYETIGYRHNEKYEYNLMGQTCDDGYTMKSHCVDCGEQVMDDPNVYYGCETHPVETVFHLEHEGMCGPITMQRTSCACGKEMGIGWNNPCDFEHLGYDEINNCGINRCRSCGVMWYDGGSMEHIPGTCLADQTFNWRFELNGEIIGSLKETFQVVDHRMVVQFTLNGQTCDEGWTANRVCVDCGKSDFFEGWGHSVERTAYYDLSEYGTCGGFYEVHSCACGREIGWNRNDECNWQWLDYDEAKRESEEYCADCSTYKYEGETGHKNPGSCTYTGENYYKLVRNDEQVLYIAMEFTHESHDMKPDPNQTVLMDPAQGCLGGVQAVEVCIDCGMARQTSYADHRTYLEHKIDLSSGCGGNLYFYSCVCGYEKAFSREMMCRNMTQSHEYDYDADGIQHNYHTDTCQDCGLVIQMESYAVEDKNSCDMTEYNLFTVTFNGETYRHDHAYTWQNHDTRFTKAVLPEGYTNCEEGVLLEWVCRDCGETGESTSNGWHPQVAVESIDLAPYGAICGGTLDKFACACGAETRYDFGTESKCDPGKQNIEEWIPNTLYVTQDTSAGYIGTYSYAWLVKCAVTDPHPCGLTIRMAEYWLNENCMAVEYQTWQLGYDEATGTCQKEITIATGEKHAYHPYVAADFNNTLADGSTEFGTRWDCPDCGSYAYHKDTHDANGIQTKYECRYVNTMYATNGENRERSDLTEYGYYANGFSYATRYYNEWVHADGYVEWNQHLYTDYDFSNNTCTRTNTWTSSESTSGGVNEKEAAHIIGECNYYNDPEPTCSQLGEGFHAHICLVCNNTEIESRWEVEPTGHSFNYDGDKQTYVCSVCALESENGVMGAIYMEDLTKADEGVYTVGYWNRDKISFQPHVSVILDDATDDDNEFVLTGITFNYLTVKDNGVCALTFSKADADAAAAQLVSDRNYSGSYAIRISLVPVESTEELDYAITFDSQNTAQ